MNYLIIKQNPQEKEPINEEKRLSGVIKMINNDVEIVPRGAYYQDRLKRIHFNYKFKGKINIYKFTIIIYIYIKK